MILNFTTLVPHITQKQSKENYQILHKSSKISKKNKISITRPPKFSMEEQEQASLPPHVLIFPLPLQGPVNSMFKLAQLLCFSGLHITLLLTENIHNRLVLHTDITSRFDQFPGFQIKTISDGLPEDHPREGSKCLEVFESIRTKTRPLFKDMLTSDLLCSGRGGKRRRVSCIIADGALGFTCDVADEIGVPIFCVRTISLSCLWIFFCLPRLVESGEIPFKG